MATRLYPSCHRAAADLTLAGKRGQTPFPDTALAQTILGREMITLAAPFLGQLGELSLFTLLGRGVGPTVSTYYAAIRDHPVIFQVFPLCPFCFPLVPSTALPHL